MDQYSNFSEEWTNKKASGKHLSHDFLEKPAMYKDLDFVAKNVLCLGCGEGSECQKILDLGAGSVTGVDNSLGLIEQAKYKFPAVNFICQDITKLNLEKKDFDLVFSSLCLHYLKDLSIFFKHLKKFLKTGCIFKFSTHHPLKWGGESFSDTDKKEFLMGYTKSKNKNKTFQIYGDYLNFRELKYPLFNRFDIKYYHRSVSQIFTEATNSGWQVTKIIEPKPLESAKNSNPDFYQVHSKIPLFIIFEMKLLSSYT